jgi:hypothetical protein
MKKLLLKLIGDAFIKALILKIGNRIADKFIHWIFEKLHAKFGNRPVWTDLQRELLELKIEDFMRSKVTAVEVELICHQCKTDAENV